MLAIYKREMHSYFTTPVGYIFLAVFFLASAFIFSLSTLEAQSADVATYFTILMYAYIVLIPLLTMRSFAEEKRAKTEQLVLTSPVSLIAMVMAKFLSAVTMLFGTFAITTIYLIPLSKYASEPNYAKYFGCFIGLFLIGVCFIAIGLFMSSLTDNQFVAAITTISLLVILIVIASINNIVDSYVVRLLFDWISIYSRFAKFSYGIFDIPAVIYYISVCVVFLFLTVRVYEKRRVA